MSYFYCLGSVSPPYWSQNYLFWVNLSIILGWKWAILTILEVLLSVSPRIDRKTIYFLKTLRSFWGGNELFLLPWKCFPPVLIAKLSILGKSFDHSRVEMSYFNYFGSVFKCFPPSWSKSCLFLVCVSIIQGWKWAILTILEVLLSVSPPYWS